MHCIDPTEVGHGRIFHGPRERGPAIRETCPDAASKVRDTGDGGYPE